MLCNALRMHVMQRAFDELLLAFMSSTLMPSTQQLCLCLLECIPITVACGVHRLDDAFEIAYLSTQELDLSAPSPAPTASSQATISMTWILFLRVVSQVGRKDAETPFSRDGGVLRTQ